MKPLKLEMRSIACATGALLLAAALKIWLVADGVVTFNSDEAVVALMARHILQGARPLFFYGQAYLGSLDAFLVAGAMGLFGQQVWVIRLVQGMLYLGVVATTGWLGKEIFGNWRVGSLAMLFLAIPTVNVTLYTTVSLGGYGEALLVGNLILISGLRIAMILHASRRMHYLLLWTVLGFLTGLGLWSFGSTLVYSLPVWIYLILLLVRTARRGASRPIALICIPLGVGILGMFIGSTPWWIYAAQNSFRKLVWELGGGAIAGVEQLPWLFQVVNHSINFLILGGTVIFGLRPPWDVIWLALPLLPFVLVFWLMVVIDLFRRLFREDIHQEGVWLLVGVAITLMAAFIFTPFGADPSGRYFIPFAIPLALFAAALVIDLSHKFGKWAYSLVILVLVYNLWGTLQCARRFPPGITTQFYSSARVDHRTMGELIAFLSEHGESYGYTNYWVSYPLAFLSQERLIFIPRLPYHPDFRYTERDDRYPPYDVTVANADRVAYITTNQPGLEEKLRAGFTDLGLTWKEIIIGGYHLFYELSRPVRPQEIGLGITSP